MMKSKSIIKVLAVCAPLLLAACGSKKAVVNETGQVTQGGGSSTPSQNQENRPSDSSATQAFSFVKKVADNAVYAENISSKITFNIQMGDKDITVPGRIQMRKDDVIRIQLMIPLLGSEVGRLEFTKDYVLVVDRMHKEYIKGDYNQLDFLKENGLNFHSLQALFWNQLFMPGSEKLTDTQLKKFDVSLNAQGNSTPVSYKQGNLTYLWDADNQSGRITKATVSYKSAAHGSSVLTMDYVDFRSVGVKQFPASQVLKFVTTATSKKKEGTISIQMNSIDTSSNWETRTTVSDKYKQVEAKDVLGKIMSM